MRGHGQTESPADPAQYSTELTVADMRGLLQHVGVERAVLGGLSLGGYVSLAFYLEHPTIVRALVICDSGPGVPERRGARRLGQPRSAGSFRPRPARLPGRPATLSLAVDMVTITAA